MSIQVKQYKVKIERIIKLYKFLHKRENDKIVRYVKKKRLTIKDGGKVDSKVIKRVFMEYPETLLDMLEEGLTSDEYKWFRSKEGSRFFAKICPEFLLVNEI